MRGLLAAIPGLSRLRVATSINKKLFSSSSCRPGDEGGSNTALVQNALVRRRKTCSMEREGCEAAERFLTLTYSTWMLAEGCSRFLRIHRPVC